MQNIIQGFLVHQTDEELTIIREPSWLLRLVLPPMTILVGWIVFLMIRDFAVERPIEFFFCVPMAFLVLVGVLCSIYYWCRYEKLTLTPTYLKYRWGAVIPFSIRDIPREDVFGVGVCDNIGRRKIAYLNPLETHRKMMKKRGYDNEEENIVFNLVFTTATRSLRAFWGSDWEKSIRPLYDLIHDFWREIPPPRSERPEISLEHIRTVSRWNCDYDGYEFILRRRGDFSPGYLFTMIGIAVFWNSIVLVFLAEGLENVFSGENFLFGWPLLIFLIPFLCVGVGTVAMVFSLLLQPLWVFTLRITKEGVRYRRRFLIFGKNRFVPADRIGETKIVYDRKPKNWGTFLDPESLQINNEIQAPYRIRIADRETTPQLTIPWLFYGEALEIERIIREHLSPA